MKKKFIFLSSFLALISSSCSDEVIIVNRDTIAVSQNVEVYNRDLLEDSYVLGVVNGSNKSYLINKEGFKLKEWTFEDNLGHDLQLLPDGKLMGMFKSLNPAFSFGGYGGKLKILNLDGTTDWEYELSTQDEITHHDFEIMPNGNILFIVWERIQSTDLVNMGVNFSNDIFLETIKEINPTNNQIVWEWHSKDHLVQDQFPSAQNFGNISLSPHKIDVNYNLQSNGDFMHANGLAYDPVKDVVFLSVNFFSEIWVIDHSTTTAQASTGLGGNYNKGGDLIYRFGNPTAYDNLQGSRYLFNNHFPNIIKDGLPGEKNLLIYNNGSNIGQSSVYEIELPEIFELTPNSNNEPNIIWSFSDPGMFNEKISGAVRLENGNTLIAEGDYGFWEVTPNGQIVWKYNGPDNSYWRCYAFQKDAQAIQALGL